MSMLSGLATPRKHARQVLALARSFSFLSHTACAGKSTKVKLSASGKRYYWLLQVLFRSIDGLIHGHAGRARVPVSVPETNARQEPLRYQDGERSDFLIPDVHVISRFASPTQIINGSSYKQTSPLSRAQLPRHPIIAASKPKRGPKSAPLRTPKRGGFRLHPRGAGDPKSPVSGLITGQGS